MLSRLAPVLVRRRRLVLVLAALALALAGAYGGGVAKNLTTGGFDDASSESVRASAALEKVFGTGEPDLLFVATPQAGSVTAPAARADGIALTRALAAEPGVAEAASYWTLGDPPPLASTRADKALVLVRLSGDDDAVSKTAERLRAAYDGQRGSLSLASGGRASVFGDVGTTIEHDLVRAEMVVLPITLVLLVLIFGSVVAASLPLAVGVLSVLGTFAVLQALAAVTDVSIYALNLTTAMGLGLAIDYSLFVVSRYREELDRGHAPTAAVVRTVRSAGRTVLFSAATVALSLSALLVFRQAFLRSFAYAGIAVAATSAIGAVVVLPALLAVIGRRIDSLRVFRQRRTAAVGEGIWHRVAVAVMRRPVGVATAAVAVLAVLGAPFLGIRFGLPDDRVLPPGNGVRAVQDVIRAEFAGDEAAAVEVVAPSAGDPSAHVAAIGAYAATLSRVPGVARVDAATGSYALGRRVAPAGPTSARFTPRTATAAVTGGTWLNVVPSVEPMSPAGERLVKAVRATPSPLGPVLVGGPSAQLVDSKASVFARVPLAGLVIALATFAVLFLMFGSVLVPVKAVALNLLSLSATFGAMVWIFQQGHLAGLLDFSATGTLDTTMPILMFCIAFGLSMDYEVFLLSRIKEEHDRGADTTTSVAVGLERTGRIVTAAAVLMAVVFFAFGTGGVTFLKMFGLGLALAVLMDAFIIRATLVPAFMKLAGQANWWAPRPLRRFHERFGISEGSGANEPSEDPASTAGRRSPVPDLAGVS